MLSHKLPDISTVRMVRLLLPFTVASLLVPATAFAIEPLSASVGLVDGEAALSAVEGTAAVSRGSTAVTSGGSLVGDAAMFADDSVTLVTRAAPVAESAGWRAVAGGLTRKVGTRFLGPVGMVIGAVELGKFLGEEGREAYDFYAAEWESWREEHRHEELMAAIDELADEGEPGHGWLAPADLGYSNFGQLKQADYAQTAAPLPAPPPMPPVGPGGDGERKDPAIAPAANPPARAYAPGAGQQGYVQMDPLEERPGPVEAPAGVTYEGVVGDPREEVMVVHAMPADALLTTSKLIAARLSPHPIVREITAHIVVEILSGNDVVVDATNQNPQTRQIATAVKEITGLDIALPDQRERLLRGDFDLVVGQTVPSDSSLYRDRFQVSSWRTTDGGFNISIEDTLSHHSFAYSWGGEIDESLSPPVDGCDFLRTILDEKSDIIDERWVSDPVRDFDAIADELEGGN